MKFFPSVAGFAALVFFPLTYAEPYFDVGGIRVGSTIAQARTAAIAINPNLVLRDLKQNDGKIVGFEGRERISIGKKPAGARSLKPDAMVEKFLEKDHVVALFTDQGVTWFVGRTQGYAAGTPRPTYGATWAALKEKFGEPSLKSDGLPFGSGSWELDRSGKLFSRKGNLISAQGPCTRSGKGTDFSAGPEGSYAINAPETFSAQCGVRIDAHIDAAASAYKSNDEGLVNFLNITVYNSALIYDGLKKSQSAANAAAAKEKESAIREAGGVKPKL